MEENKVLVSTKYNFQWTIAALCLSPLIFLFSIENGNFIFIRIVYCSVLSLLTILLISFFTIRKYVFYKNRIECLKLFAFNKDFGLTILFDEIKKIEFSESLKGNSAFIVSFSLKDKTNILTVPMKRKKALLIYDYLKSGRFDQIKFINLP